LVLFLVAYILTRFTTGGEIVVAHIGLLLLCVFEVQPSSVELLSAFMHMCVMQDIRKVELLCIYLKTKQITELLVLGAVFQVYVSKGSITSVWLSA
jgi:hypothetical protein